MSSKAPSISRDSPGESRSTGTRDPEAFFDTRIEEWQGIQFGDGRSRVQCEHDSPHFVLKSPIDIWLLKEMVKGDCQRSCCCVCSGNKHDNGFRD
jgi:hypothetical protein